jgi:hypothetical protein
VSSGNTKSSGLRVTVQTRTQVSTWNDDVAEPNGLAKVGGSTVGGGVSAPEDPSPQARFQKELELASKSAENRDVSRQGRVIGLNPVTGSFPESPGSALHTSRVSCSGSSGDTELGLGPLSF